MRITINGEAEHVPDGARVADVAREGCAVAINGEVVPRARHGQSLAEGDRVEVVTAVAGG